MTDKTKSIISKVSLGLVVLGSVGAIACGVGATEVSNGVLIADSIVVLVSSLISFIFKR